MNVYNNAILIFNVYDKLYFLFVHVYNFVYFTKIPSVSVVVDSLIVPSLAAW